MGAIGSRLRNIRDVFHTGSFANYRGKMAQVTSNCTPNNVGDYEVQVKILGATTSSWAKAGALTEATETEYEQAVAAFNNQGHVQVSIYNLAGCAMLELSNMHVLTKVADIKDNLAVQCSTCSAVEVRLQHESEELSDLCTLERFQDTGIADLTCIYVELSISNEDRLFYLRELSFCKRYSHLEEMFAGLSEAARADEELVLHAIGQDAHLLRHAHRSARANKTIVLKAIDQIGDALEFADPSLQADRQVALRAAQQNRRSIRFADISLRADASFIIEAGGSKKKWNKEVLTYACPSLWEDMRFVKSVAARDKRLLHHAREGMYEIPTRLLASKRFVVNVLKESPEQLSLADEYMKNDIDLVLAAVSTSGETLQYASDQLKKNKLVVSEAVRQNPQALRHAHECFQMTGAGGRKEALKKLAQ